VDTEKSSFKEDGLREADEGTNLEDCDFITILEGRTAAEGILGPAEIM